jgi:hypothetical protein
MRQRGRVHLKTDPRDAAERLAESENLLDGFVRAANQQRALRTSSWGLAARLLSSKAAAKLSMPTFIRGTTFIRPRRCRSKPPAASALDCQRLRKRQILWGVEVIHRAPVSDLEGLWSLWVIEQCPGSRVASQLQYRRVALDRQNGRRTCIVVPSRHARRRRRQAPGVAQGAEIVRREAILIARQNQRRGSTHNRHADCKTERCRDPLLPFLVDSHLDRQVRYRLPVAIRITSENHQHSPNACLQRAATLPSQ